MEEKELPDALIRLREAIKIKIDGLNKDIKITNSIANVFYSIKNKLIVIEPELEKELNKMQNIIEMLKVLMNITFKI